MAWAGGVLERAGHTEAAVDISILAGLNPSGVICEILSEDGTMARLPELIEFAKFHNLKIGTVSDLIKYRLKNHKIIKVLSERLFESEMGTNFSLKIFENELSGESVFNAVRGHVEEVDYRFVVINSRVAIDNDLTPFQNICVKAYRFVKSTGLKPAEDFGLDKTNVTVDYVPISVTNTFEQEVIEDFEDYSVT